MFELSRRHVVAWVAAAALAWPAALRAEVLPPAPAMPAPPASPTATPDASRPVRLGGGASESSSRETYALRHDYVVDGAITALAGALWIASDLAKPALGASACRWCDVGPDGTKALNPLDRGVRDALRWSRPERAGGLSDVTAYVVAPVAALGLTAVAAGHDDVLGDFPANALIVIESAFIAANVGQVLKFTFGRARPYLQDGDAAGADPHDAFMSFPSGHTTLAFALAASSGTVASLRGYRWAPIVWSVGIAAAAGTAYLRIAADKHYLTDVLAGAAVGTAVGVGVPMLFHRRAGARSGGDDGGLAVVPQGAGVALRYTW